MEITPVTPAVRTVKVRTTKAAAPKSDTAIAKPKPAAAPRKRKTLTKKAVVSEPAMAIDPTPMIATAAYFMAERRHFAPGHELQDWLAAEQLICGSPAAK